MPNDLYHFRLLAVHICCLIIIFFFKHKTAYEMRISDWSSDVCSSDLRGIRLVDHVDLVGVVVGYVKAASGRIEGNAGRLRADGGEGVGLLQAAVEVHREHVGVAEERRLVDLRVDQEQAARDGVVRQAGGIRAAEDRKSTRLNSS